MTFEELGLAPALLRAVAAEGYSIPTPIQAQAIPHVAAGRDLLGCAQTGTGKTAAFALPIMHRLMAEEPPRGQRRRVRVLVLAPTRELACQIGESFSTYGRHAGLRHCLVFGGVSQVPQVRNLRQGVDILIATPGRLCDLMNQGCVDLSTVEIFVLDEADRMFDMGFLPDLRRVIAKLPTRRQTVFFSATMPDAIRGLATSILRNPVHVKIEPVKATTELIQQSVYHVPRTSKPKLLMSLMTEGGIDRAIVFTRTKHGADRVAKDLDKGGVPAEAIHGNKSQNARQRALANFKANKIQVLVATDVAARGIDIDGVSHVFNFDLPHEPETYVHRIGRTGRAGANGIAIAFCDHDERADLRAIEHLIRKQLFVETNLPAGVEAADRAPLRRDAGGSRAQAGRPRRNGQTRGLGSNNQERPRPNTFGKPGASQPKRQRRIRSRVAGGGPRSTTATR